MEAYALGDVLPREARIAIVSFEAGVADHCKALYDCWESSLSPVEEQQVILTTEPSLWHPCPVNVFWREISTSFHGPFHTLCNSGLGSYIWKLNCGRNWRPIGYVVLTHTWVTSQTVFKIKHINLLESLSPERWLFAFHSCLLYPRTKEHKGLSQPC